MTLSPTLMARAARAFGIAAVLLSVLVFRVVSSAREELRRADALLAQNDLDGSVLHYRRAARWYAPGSPYHVSALDQLLRIGREAEARAEVERALSAYRAARGAIMAARSFYVPEAARLQAANERIAVLMSEQPAPGMDAGKSREQLRAEHLALLQRAPGPSVLWTLVLLLGFASWIGAAFAFSMRAIDEHDRWVLPEARKWGAVIVLGFGLFVLGMALA